MDKKYNLENYLTHFDWMGDEVWSYSRVCCYDSCPRAFKYTYIDKLEGTGKFVYSPPLIKGSYIHSRLELLFLMATSNKPKPSLYNPFQHNGVDGVNITEEDKNNWDKLLDTCYRTPEFINILETAMKATFISTEYKIECPNLFKGFIDLIFVSDHTLYIIDWKTGKKRDYDFYQTSTYAYTFLQRFQFKYAITNIVFGYFFIEEPDYKLIESYTVEEFSSKYQYVLDWYKSVMTSLKSEPYKLGYVSDSEGWKRIKSDGCRWCPMADYCEKDYIKDARDFIKCKPSDSQSYIS